VSSLSVQPLHFLSIPWCYLSYNTAILFQPWELHFWKTSQPARAWSYMDLGARETTVAINTRQCISISILVI
jgi:hypothetical protein